MTPAETIIATTFPGTSMSAKILGDRVLLSLDTVAAAQIVLAHCDALLPPLELMRAPLLVYLHCAENQSFYEIDESMMVTVGLLHTLDYDP